MISIQRCKTRLLQEIQTLKAWMNCMVTNLRISNRLIRTRHTFKCNNNNQRIIKKQVIRAEMLLMISAGVIITQYQIKVTIFQENNFQELKHNLAPTKLSKVSDENSASSNNHNYLRLSKLSHLIQSISSNSKCLWHLRKLQVLKLVLIAAVIAKNLLAHSSSKQQQLNQSNR